MRACVAETFASLEAAPSRLSDIAVNTPMIAITINNSTNVKADLECGTRNAECGIAQFELWRS